MCVSRARAFDTVTLTQGKEREGKKWVKKQFFSSDDIIEFLEKNPECAPYVGVSSGISTKDFDKLLVTLHRVNKDLDDGDIIKRDKVKIRKNMEIFQFRSEQIKTCLDLATSSISLYEKNGEFLSKPQKLKGRYYSFMPSALKKIAINNFNKFISGGLFNN